MKVLHAPAPSLARPAAAALMSLLMAAAPAAWGATATKPAAAPAAAAAPAKAPAKPVPKPGERELHLVATVDATQDWKKNDPEYPGEQWSKGSTRQRYEIRTRLRTDGVLQVRNVLDPNLDARLEAKTIFLARQAVKYLGKPGAPAKLPKTQAEIDALTRDLRIRMIACEAEPNCMYETQIMFASIMAAMQYPEALEEEDVPGRYLYYLPYDGCPEASHVVLDIAIDGVRYNKDVDKFIPFKERRSADTRNASDGLAMCKHMLAVIDTENPAKPMYQETIYIPNARGITEYTENNHTSREEQNQPMPTAVTDWIGLQLAHTTTQGKLAAELPLILPLNANATWQGLWTGSAKVNLEWSFKEVAASTAPPKP